MARGASSGVCNSIVENRISLQPKYSPLNLLIQVVTSIISGPGATPRQQARSLGLRQAAGLTEPGPRVSAGGRGGGVSRKLPPQDVGTGRN